MAFQEFKSVRHELRKDGDDNETGILVAGYITDDAHPGLRERVEFWIEGDEHAALSGDSAAREYQVTGIVKREVAARHTAWVASLAAPAGVSEVQDAANLDLTDLDDAATAYDPDTDRWVGGWGDPPVEDTDPPVFVSGLVAGDNVVVITFSEPVESPSLGLMAGARIRIDNSIQDLLNAVADENTVAYTVDTAAIVGGQTVEFLYNASLGDYQDAAGNSMATMGAYQPVTNNNP